MNIKPRNSIYDTAIARAILSFLTLVRRYTAALRRVMDRRGHVMTSPATMFFGTPCFSRKDGWQLIVAGLLLAMANPASRASGALVIDQSFVESNPPSGFNLAEGAAFVGQTVTTGVTGQLLAVEINVGRRSDFLIPWLVDIQEVVGGQPTGVVLSSTRIPPEHFPRLPITSSPITPLVLSVAMNVGIPFQVGDQFAIVVHPEGISGSPGLSAGVWGGGDGYAGGTALAGPDASSLSPSNGDVHFRTLMFVVPEPNAAALLAIGALCAFSLRHSRQGVGGHNSGCVTRQIFWQSSPAAKHFHHDHNGVQK